MNLVLRELNKRKLFYTVEKSILDYELLFDNQRYNRKVVLSDLQDPYTLHIYFNNSDTYFVKMTRADKPINLVCIFGSFMLTHIVQLIDSYEVKENSVQRSERLNRWVQPEHDRMIDNPLPFEIVPDVPCARCEGTGAHENSRKGNSCYQCKGKGFQTTQDIKDCARWKKNYFQNLATQELDEITFMEEEYKRQSSK